LGETASAVVQADVVDGLMSDDRVVVRSSHGISSDNSESFGDGLPVGVGLLCSSGSASGEVVDGETSGGNERICSIGPFVV